MHDCIDNLTVEFFYIHQLPVHFWHKLQKSIFEDYTNEKFSFKILQAHQLQELMNLNAGLFGSNDFLKTTADFEN